MRNQRRVDFDLPKHIYCNRLANGEECYYFRLTRRPRYFTGKPWPTVEDALNELQSFLLLNPDKRPRFNGNSSLECAHYKRWEMKRRRGKQSAS